MFRADFFRAPRFLFSLVILSQALLFAHRHSLASLIQGSFWDGVYRLSNFSKGGLGGRRMLLAFLMGVAVFGGGKLFNRTRAMKPRRGGRTPVWALPLAQLVAFGIFLFSSTYVMGKMVEPSATATNFVLLWLVSGAATVGLALITFLPASANALLARELVPPVGWGLAFMLLSTGGGLVARSLWGSMSSATFLLVKWQLSLLTEEAGFNPVINTIYGDKYSAAIQAGCSGMEGIGLWWSFLSLYLYHFRSELRFPQVLSLFPFGTVVMWLANSVRITAVFLMGNFVSKEVATHGFHDQSGWILFIGLSLAMVALAQNLKFFRRCEPDPVPPAADDDLPALIVPLLATIAASMATGAFTGEDRIDWLYPIRVIVCAGVLWHFRDRYRQILKSRFCWPMVILGIAVALLWLVVAPPGNAGTTSVRILTHISAGAAGFWIVFKTLGFIVTVPLAEELAFRGFMIPRLERMGLPAFRGTVACLLSAGFFAFFHSGWVAGFVAGLAYALAFKIRGRVLDAFLAHASTNAGLAVYVFATGRWAAWS